MSDIDGFNDSSSNTNTRDTYWRDGESGSVEVLVKVISQQRELCVIVFMKVEA